MVEQFPAPNRNPQRATAIVALLLLLAMASACKGKGKEGPPGAGGHGAGMQGPPPVAVMAAAAELRDYAPGIELSGELRARQSAVLAAEVSGKVLGVEKRVGESCAKGKAVIRIDPASYQVSLDAAKATLEQERQKLSELKNGALDTELAAQQALVDSAQARYDDAAASLARFEELHSKGYVTDEELSKARADADAARAALEREQQNLRKMQEGTRTESLAAQEARVQQAEASVKAAELALARTNVSPAFDGEVSALMCEAGQYVGPGTPLVEVVSAGAPEAWFAAGEDVAGSLAPGDSVDLGCAAFPGEVFEGSVISVAPQANPGTRQFPLRVKLSDTRLKAGMAVTGRILSAAPKPTLMISADATLQGKLGPSVWRVLPPAPAAPGDAGAAAGGPGGGAGGMPPLPGVESVAVETGAMVDGWVVVLKGDLKPGDMLVTRGKENLYPGAKVMLGQPPQAPPAPGSGAPDSGGSKPPGADAGAADSEAAQGSQAGTGK